MVLPNGTTLQYQVHYRTAVALNNAGVSFVQRHHFELAASLFNDAVVVLRTLLKGGVSSEGREKKLAEIVRGAAKLLAYTRAEDPQRSKEGSASAFKSIEVPDDVSPANVLSTAPSKMDGCPFVAIRIEPHDDDLRHDASLELQSAIILNNYCAAFRGLAAKASSPWAADDFRRRGLNVLFLSHSAMSKVLLRPRDTDQALSIAFLILRNVVSAAIDTGVELSRVNRFQQQLIRLQTVLEDLVTFARNDLSPHAAAA